MTQIDVIRHGEPEGGQRYRGYSIDDALTEKGWQQMWNAVPDQPGWNVIISSPMKRCQAFAAALAEKLSIEHHIVDDFKEIGFGVWEGLTPDEIIAADPDALTHFYEDPVNNRPQNAESLESFSERVWAAYMNVAKRYIDQHILIVGHAGVARAITGNVLHMHLADVYSRIKIEYGGIVSSLIDDEGSPKLIIQGK